MKGFEAMKVGVCLWWILMLSSSCAMGQCHPKDLNALMVRWQVLSTETHDLMTSVHAQFADVNMQLAELSKQISRQDDGIKKKMNGATLQISKIETQLESHELKINTLQTGTIQLQDAYEQLVGKDENIHEQIDKLCTQLENHEQTVSLIQTNQNYTEHAYMQLQANDYRISEQNSAIRTSLNHSANQRSMLEKQLENHDQKIDAINDYQAALDILQAQLTEKDETLSKQTIELQRQINETSIQSQDVKNQVINCEYRISLIQANQTFYEYLNKQLLKNDDDFSERVDEIAKQLNESILDMGMLKNKLKGHEQEINLINEDQTQYVQDKAQLATVLSKEINDFRKIVNETVIHNKELEQKMETQEQNLNSIQANLKQIENEEYILGDRIDGITKQSNLSLTDMEKLKKELENLESRISSINAKVEIAFVVHTPPSSTLTQNAAIQFKTVILNTGSGYDAGSGKFTATVAGTYMFSAQICGDQKSSIVYQIVVNGVRYSASEQYEYDKVGACSSVMTVASLNTGAIVWVKCVSSESNLFISNNQWNMFSGMLVNARI